MKNVIVEKMKDGSFKVEILILNITTWAYHEDDVDTAVNEAIEALTFNARRYGCVETMKLIRIWYANQ